MNPVLEEIYSTIIPSAPYIIVAYAAIWVVLLIVFLLLFSRFRKAERQLDILEEEVAERAPKAPEALAD